MKKEIFLGANWKMNTIPNQALRSDSPFLSEEKISTVVFPLCIDASVCHEHGLIIGAQYGRAEACGAFTGDVSLAMMKERGCSYALVGHSERRIHHCEAEHERVMQVQVAQSLGMIPILCIGETMEERSMGSLNDVYQTSLEQVIRSCVMTRASIIIAYEPVWAIGSGITPTSLEVNATHAHIRSLLPDPSIRILYGGSVNQENCASFVKEEHVDGLLVGGASLNTDGFQVLKNTLRSM